MSNENVRSNVNDVIRDKVGKLLADLPNIEKVLILTVRKDGACSIENGGMSPAELFFHADIVQEMARSERGPLMFERANQKPNVRLPTGGEA